MQNISANHTAIWQQRLAADFSSWECFTYLIAWTQWIILLSKIWLFLNFGQTQIKISQKDSGFQICAFAYAVAELIAIFLLNESYKTYQWTMLPPSGRNWQLIYPNRTTHKRHLCRKTTVFSCHRCLIKTGVIKLNNI